MHSGDAAWGTPGNPQTELRVLSLLQRSRGVSKNGQRAGTRTQVCLALQLAVLGLGCTSAPLAEDPISRDLCVWPASL